MKANNSSKKFWDRTSTFKIHNSVFLAILLCIVGIAASLFIQLYRPPWANTISDQNEIIIQKLESRNSDSLLILYGSGTVQTYLEKQGIQSGTNLIILPAPSLFACQSLSDDNFLRHWMGNTIIMSSTKANDDNFKTKNKHSQASKKILEVFLDTDTLYIQTSKDSIYNIYKEEKGIKPDQLIKLLKEENKKSNIYITSKQSGTWNEYKKITNNVIDNIDFKEYDLETHIEDNSIVLTRTYYDPIKHQDDDRPYHTIKVLNENGSPKIDSLYLYFPIVFDEKSNNPKPQRIIDKFLSSINRELDYTDHKIYSSNDSIIIRCKDTHYKSKK